MEDEPEADFFEVTFEPCEGAISDRDDAVFAAFALADSQGLALGVEVGDLQLGQLEAADAGAVEELTIKGVAKAEERSLRLCP
jgi:hypothetical protein